MRLPSARYPKSLGRPTFESETALQRFFEKKRGRRVGPGIVLAPEPPRPPAVRRFHGSVALDPARLGRDAGRIAEEIVQHLTTQKGATVRLTLEIEADLPEGASESVVRTVTENARTLKFRVQGFEAD